MIRIGNIKNNSINPFVAKTCISDEYAAETDSYLIRENDILFTMTGTRGKRDYFYSCRIEKSDLEGLKLFLNQRVGCLRLVSTADILPSYFVNAIQSSCVLDAIFATETGNVNQGNIGSTATLNLLIPVAPTKEQYKIQEKSLSILSAIEQYDIETEDLSTIINKMRTKILDLAIRGQLVPQNPDDEPASVLLERIRAEKDELIKQGKLKPNKKESIIFKGEDNSYYEKVCNTVENINGEIPFELPDGWVFVRLKELWELISGRDLSSSEYNAEGAGIPYITGASNFTNGKVELVRWTTSPQVITKTGDLLLTCKGTIGEMAFNNFGDAHIARQIMAIRNTFGLNPEYLALCMSFHISAIKNVAKGLIPGISREDILSLILPVPPRAYQARVVKQMSMLTSFLISIEKSLN